MSKLRNIVALILFIVTAMLAVYGCDNNTPSNGTPTPGSKPPGGGDPSTVIKAAHAAMANLKSFHFTVTGTKDKTVNLNIEGDIEPPDKGYSKYTTTGQPSGELVIFGKDTYLKQPGSEVFMRSPGGYNPPDVVGGLLNPVGLTYYALLGDSSSLVGDEKVDGVDTTHVTFTFNPAKIKSLAAEQAKQPTPAPQKTEDATYKGDMWVEKGANYVRKLQWFPPLAGVGTPDAGVQRTVLVTYSKFNEPISPPIQIPAAAVTRTPTPTAVPEEP